MRVIPKLLLVCIGQAVLAWFFYRSRAVTHSWADSDFLILGVPLLGGLAASALVLFRSSFAKTTAWKRGAAILGLATVCALISSFLGTVLGFNMYGA